MPLPRDQAQIESAGWVRPLPFVPALPDQYPAVAMAGGVRGSHLQHLVASSAVVQIHAGEQLTGLNEVQVCVYERGHQSTVQINFLCSGRRRSAAASLPT